MDDKQHARGRASIRHALLADHAGLMAVVEASGLFPPGESGEIDAMLASHFAGTLGDDHVWIVADTGDQLIGIAYYAPERMTSGTWNLYLIAVRPEHRGYGHGSAMVGFVEQALRDRGERLLLVETTGLESFAATRAFYRKAGYEQEARIRDFYEEGTDKVVFRKAL